jgi:hypothetical protein
VGVVTGAASAPVLSYALTTDMGPVVPGQGIQFTVTVTNLSSATQSVFLNHDVPQFTTSNGYAAGSALSYNMGYIAGGATKVASLDFKVLSGTQAPPDGSLITAMVSDGENGGLVSSSLAVNHTLAMLERPASPLGKLVFGRFLNGAPNHLCVGR